jgi:hypothetical protein
MGYAERDRHIIDYGLYEIPGIAPYEGHGIFRGPRVTGGDYIACVGAAQTFGCFCLEPYPVLLARKLRIETLNLGYGGAGPTFHNSNARLLSYINGAKLVIVQVLSARSQSNSYFRTPGHARQGVRVADGRSMPAERFYYELALNEPDKLPLVVNETRRNYVRDMRRLLHDIRPPKILFWFSRRYPHYEIQYELPMWNIFRNFPQLVNKPMVDEIRTAADNYVECVTRRGMPQPLHDRDGAPTTVNFQDEMGRDGIVATHKNYYPSPEMHVDAAEALAVPCRELLHARQRALRPREAPSSGTIAHRAL